MEKARAKPDALRGPDRPTRRADKLNLASALDPEDHRKREIQSLVGDQRRRLRYRIGSSHHRQRRFVERPVARSLDDAGREHMAHPIEREADEDLGALLRALRRIALVLVQMRHQFLLPAETRAPCAFTGALRRGDRARSLSNSLRARRRGRLGGNRVRRGVSLYRCDLRTVLFWPVGIVRRHHPIGIVGLSGYILWQLGFLKLRLLLGKRGRSDGSIGIRTGREVGGLSARRHPLQAAL